MKKILSPFALCSLYCFGCASEPSTKFSADQKDTCVTIRNEKQEQTLQGGLSIVILSNTLNDTALINSSPVPPGKTGEWLFTRDFYANEVKLCFKKHKATKGSVSIKCQF